MNSFLRSLPLLAVLLAACAPKYGQQACKADSECPTGEFCALGCAAGIDAGAGHTVSALCQKACTTDADCSSLGLKKPLCAKSTCSADSCVDNPF